MLTPASFPQVVKFVKDALGDPTSERMQVLLANSGLFKELAQANFSGIDRDAFRAALTSARAPIAWRPVNEYAEKITRWNNLRSWGFTEAQISMFAKTLVDHSGPLQPTGVSLWLGRDLAFNWEEVTVCLRLEVEALGGNFTQYVDSSKVKFYPGSEQGGRRKLAVALLDLATYWDPVKGVVSGDIRLKETRLPGLEVAWLLALNALTYLAIDYKTMPGLVAAGLVIDAHDTPSFSRDSNTAFVHGIWADGGCYGSVVHFRE